MDFLSGKTVECLFKSDSFLNAIKNKDIEAVNNDIRKICGFHLESTLNTPVCKMAKAKLPDRFVAFKQTSIKEFEQEIEWLAKTIVELGIGIVRETEIDPQPLINAIRHNRIDALKFYFWIGGTPNLKTNVDPVNQRGGESLIHFAAQLDENHIIRFMIENGADVNAKTTYGMEKPIHRATMSGNQDMVRLLWGCVTDINAPRNGGETPLMIATKNSDLSIVYLLIRLGADVKATDIHGRSASDLAIAHGADEIFDMLRDREAGVEFPMIKGFPFFKYARERNIQSI